MDEEQKPIKRSEELAPLSRDHHEGLLLVWKIRQGLKKSVDENEIAAYVQWFWSTHLETHFREEEQLLAPHMPADDQLLKRMFDEHEEIKALVNISNNVADGELLNELATKLNDHIRFEERELFNHAEKIIPAYELQQIGEQLHKEKVECEKWENEFWNRKS